MSFLIFKVEHYTAKIIQKRQIVNTNSKQNSNQMKNKKKIENHIKKFTQKKSFDKRGKKGK